MPSSSFDTFFACTIIVAVALIAIAFLGSTMQTRIESTQDINKDAYLIAIADHIVTNPGAPADWGTNSALPVDFGLAQSQSTSPYALDMDKISRLNSLNTYSLSYINLEQTAKLNNIALGIRVSQLLSVDVVQTSNSTVGSDTSFTFTVSTIIDSKPTSANLHCYAVADNYLAGVNGTVPDTGVGEITAQIPTALTDNALLIVFARASIDDRVTSYAIYNFASSTQESTPTSTTMDLSPNGYVLNVNSDLHGLTIQNSHLLSYSHQQSLLPFDNSKTPIPKLIDKSPMVMVVSGVNGAESIQEWTAYPQVPLSAGSSFAGSEQNVFSYVVTIEGVLYRLDLSLGDPPK